MKGGDALLYHALRLYKLLPELRWSAGGYVWPVDATVSCGHPTLARVASTPKIHSNTRSPPNGLTSLSNHASPNRNRPHRLSSYSSTGSNSGSTGSGGLSRSSAAFALTPYRDRDSGNGSDSDSEEYEREQAAVVRRKEMELSIAGDAADADAIRMMVEKSGAVLITDAGIMLLSEDTPGTSSAALTRERVPLIATGGLDKLIVNVLIVVFVP